MPKMGLPFRVQKPKGPPGFWATRLLGWDIFAEGYGTGSILGIALVGLGGGLGLHLARRWRTTRAASTEHKEN